MWMTLKKLNNSNIGCNLYNVFFCAFMYADDIVLLTASVEHLQKLISLCYSEFDSIGLDINVAKSSATRVGPRYKNICVDIAINDKVLPWVHEIKYLGLTFSDGLCLKVNVIPNKVAFFRNFNSIYAKLGSFASADTLIHMMKCNCLSSLLFGLESVRLSKTDVHNLSFPLNRAFIKMLHINESVTIK